GAVAAGPPRLGSLRGGGTRGQGSACLAATGRPRGRAPRRCRSPSPSSSAAGSSATATSEIRSTRRASGDLSRPLAASLAVLVFLAPGCVARPRRPPDPMLDELGQLLLVAFEGTTATGNRPLGRLLSVGR